MGRRRAQRSAAPAGGPRGGGGGGGGEIGIGGGGRFGGLGLAMRAPSRLGLVYFPICFWVRVDEAGRGGRGGGRAWCGVVCACLILPHPAARKLRAGTESEAASRFVLFGPLLPAYCASVCAFSGFWAYGPKP